MFSSYEALFSPEHFRQAGHALIDQVADYLAQVRQSPTLAWIAPETEYQFWKETSFDSLTAFFDAVLARSIHIHHPQYIGHQTATVLPETSLASLVSGLLNNGMAVYEMGAAASAMERVLIEGLAPSLGFSAQAGGFFTSGGTLANLTALLAARAAKAQTDVWQTGQTTPLALMVSEEAHYCVDRAVRMMGWGADGIIKVPTNERFQMRIECLKPLWEAATAQGRQVIAVVGSAGTTSTGSFDDLAGIGAFCAAHDLWFHVDGAHGAALALSEKYRPKTAGLEVADSVAMDFHKLLATPALTTALFFKEDRAAYQTFKQRADYLLEETQDLEWHNLGRRTIECTKGMIVLKAFMLFKQHGLPFFDAHVTRLHDLTAGFSQLISAAPDFELAVPPETNIVCFRYLHPKGNLSALNRAIRQQLLEDGAFYIVQTVLRGETWLRATVMNPLTTEADFIRLLETIRGLAAKR